MFGAATVAATQLYEPQFLQPQEAYTNFGTQTCQFIYDNSWYQMIDTSTLGSVTVFNSTDLITPTTEAYFTYCQDIPSAFTCTGSYFASINVNGVCELNSNSVVAGSLDVNGVSTFAMVYQGASGSAVTSLTVGQVCDESASGVTTSSLTSSPDGTSYSTYQSSSVACPVFTYNALI